MLKKVVVTKCTFKEKYGYCPSLEFIDIAKENELSEMKENAVFLNTDTGHYCVVKDGLLIEIIKDDNYILSDALILMAKNVYQRNSVNG